MINDSSAKTLNWVTAILLVIGLMMMSPMGSFAVFVLAAVVAAMPAVFSAGKIRIIAVILLALTVLLAAGKYPDFQLEYKHYRNMAK
ncbi:MAG TPA: hypothetical protein PK114_03875 [Smithellaceae bacterium]|nr:hypothetical protein [Smithellaceae bacterium]